MRALMILAMTGFLALSATQAQAAYDYSEFVREGMAKQKRHVVLWGINEPQSDADYHVAERLHAMSQSLSMVCRPQHSNTPRAFADWFVEVVDDPSRFRKVHAEMAESRGGSVFIMSHVFGYWWKITHCS